MGRKIPAKKHRGVKDPLQQQAARLQKLKGVINAPPAHPDDQPIPKSLTRLLEFKQRFENKQKQKQKKTYVEIDDNRENEVNSGKSVANLKRLPNETSRSFNLRINSVIRGINKGQLHEKEMDKTMNPDQYNMSDEDAKEERMDYIEKKKAGKKERKLKQKRKDNSSEEPKLSRMKKWTLKKKAKLEKKSQEKEDDNFEPRYDTFKFGDIVHEPPSLHIKPRRAQQIDGAPRPGRKDLLLNKLLNPSSTREEEVPKVSSAKTTAVKNKMTFDKKAKRKDLPMGVRLRLEQSQKEAIEAYRALKKERLKS